MKSILRHATIGLLTSAVMSACTPHPATEIVVRVDTNLAPATELRSFRIVVRRVGASAPITDLRFDLASGRYSFPAGLGVVPRDPADARRVHIEVSGQLNGSDVAFTTTAIVGVRAEHVSVIDMFLARECTAPGRQAQCASMNMTCGRDGACVPIELPSLPDLDGGMDAATPANDARLDDGTLDAPDAAVPDVAPDASDPWPSTSGPRQPGAPCRDGTDCDTGVCLPIGRCSRACSSAANCPSAPNWTCTPLGNATVCQCSASGTETCDGLDNDCDGRIDNVPQTTLDEDANNCGTCGRRCTAICEAGQCLEPVQLAAGSFHTCVRFDDGSIRCWGLNTQGQLGDGTTLQRSAPTRTVPPITGATWIATAAHSTCAVLADATVLCTGMIMNAATPPTSFVPVAGIAGAVEIALNDSTACVRQRDGHVLCWGDNASGQLGDGTMTSRTTPALASGITNAASMAVGGSQVCVRLTDGSVRCWGSNCSSEATGVPGPPVTSPSPVSGFPVASAISLVGTSGCGTAPDGSVSCWGFGSIATTMATNCSVSGCPSAFCNTGPSPLQAVNDAVGISIGTQVGCVLRRDASVSCWGANTYGMLGNGSGGSSTPTFVPVTAMLPMGATHIAVGVEGVHACAILLDHSVRCWGGNAAGQLGDGTMIERATPSSVRW